MYGEYEWKWVDIYGKNYRPHLHGVDALYIYIYSIIIIMYVWHTPHHIIEDHIAAGAVVHTYMPVPKHATC